MDLLRCIGLLLLALALIVGSGVDIVPETACDADDEAGDEFLVSEARVEPVLISEVDFSAQVPSSIIVRRIPHVPK